MQKYETALFDLDGTITDSGPGIMESVQYALTKFGYPEQSEETLRQFVGPSLVDSFTRLYHMTYKEAEQATAAYREVYNTGNLYHAKLYDGIEMVFQRLWTPASESYFSLQNRRARQRGCLIILVSQSTFSM